MRKLNNKGYMLVEIIMAFAITFALIYFLMDLVINLKNKNDDLLVDTIIKTDQTIISNKLLEHIIEDTSDEGNVTFSCDKIKVNEEKNTVIYDVNGDDLGGDDDSILGIIDDSATISYDATDNCKNENGKIHINIPVEVKQMSDKNYDIVVDYRYKLIYCNPLKSFKCANDSEGNAPYAFEYDGNCDVSGNEDNWKVKFLSVGTKNFISNCDMEIDVFLVGGGGGGASSKHAGTGGGGGGGGYTTTASTIIEANKSYELIIGKGGKGGTENLYGEGSSGTRGGTTSGFDFEARGGGGGSPSSNGGGTGGSNGGGGGWSDGYGNRENGKNGKSNCNDNVTTTCEFGELGGTPYAGGGGGGRGCTDGCTGAGRGGAGGGGAGGSDDDTANGPGKPGAANTGGGGGGGAARHEIGGNGGSGIIIIRKAK